MVGQTNDVQSIWIPLKSDGSARNKLLYFFRGEDGFEHGITPTLHSEQIWELLKPTRLPSIHFHNTVIHGDYIR